MGIDLESLHIHPPNISEMTKEKYDHFFNQLYELNLKIPLTNCLLSGSDKAKEDFTVVYAHFFSSLTGNIVSSDNTVLKEIFKLLLEYLYLLQRCKLRIVRYASMMTVSYIFFGLLYTNDNFERELKSLENITNTKIQSKKVLLEI